MKEAPNTAVMSKLIEESGGLCPTRKTVSKWMWFHIREINELHHKVIVWENWKTNDMGKIAWCLLIASIANSNKF